MCSLMKTCCTGWLNLKCEGLCWKDTLFESRTVTLLLQGVLCVVLDFLLAPHQDHKYVFEMCSLSSITALLKFV
jgi:hypothetical protein